MISIVVSYALVMVLNYNQVHEAALLPCNIATDPGSTINEGIPSLWQNGMGHFVKMTGTPATVIKYIAGDPPDQFVQVTTTVVGNPFLPVPLPCVNVPGLNGPFTFQITSQCQMENPDYAQPQP
jgi:hypothetical protein